MAHPDVPNQRRRRHSMSLHDVRGAHVPLLQHDDTQVKLGRTRGEHMPEPGTENYKSYATHRKLALEMALKELQCELNHRTVVQCLILENDRLIIQYHSQSKLTQQELSDLQKATHFDKKELQQWYKGMLPAA